MIELMPHQVDAVEKMANGKILWGGVGTGKSLTVLEYYRKNESPKDIYVITTAKKRDSLEWQRDALKLNIGMEESAHGLLHIDSWNNIGKYVDVEDAFFIFDEQRLVGGGAWVKSFYKIARKNRWVLLSATPGDTWMDYIPVFVANGLYRNVTEFKQQHVVYVPFAKFPKILKYLGTAQLERYRNMLLVEMPYEKHTQRLIEEIYTDYDLELFKKVHVDRWHIYEDRPLTDVGEMFRVMRRLVASHPSRLQAVRDLLQIHPKTIIYYNFDYELDILRRLVDQTTVAEWNGHKKQPIPQTDSWVYLVQYVAGAEGWNCIETDTVAFFSMTYSYKNFEQAMGRIDRLNTPFTLLHYVIFLSNSLIDTAVRNSRLQKQGFNERAYAFEEWGDLGDFGRI